MFALRHMASIAFPCLVRFGAASNHGRFWFLISAGRRTRSACVGDAGHEQERARNFTAIAANPLCQLAKSKKLGRPALSAARTGVGRQIGIGKPQFCWALE